MATLDVKLPPGYGGLSVLDRKTHAGLGLAAGALRFAAYLHAIYLSLPEFVAAARVCPVVFIETAAGTPSPAMLTGLEQSLNLCVDAAGDWLADVYCPAYVRRYPFCTARVGADAEQTVICVDESALDDTAPALFTAEGEESSLWQSRLKLIQELEAAGRQTEVFCARLQALQLLEPFDADIQPASGERKRLSGMFRVSESRLNTLPAETLTELMRSGFLSRIYAHLMSLDNFQRLLALDANRLNAMPRH